MLQAFTSQPQSSFTYPFYLKLASMIALGVASLALIGTLHVLFHVEGIEARNMLVGSALWILLAGIVVFAARRMYHLHTAIRITHDTICAISPFGGATCIAWTDIAMLDHRLDQGRLDIWSATTNLKLPIFHCLNEFDRLHMQIEGQILAARHAQLRNIV